MLHLRRIFPRVLQSTRRYSHRYVFTEILVIDPDLMFMKKTNADLLRLKKHLYALEQSRQCLQEQMEETAKMMDTLLTVTKCQQKILDQLAQKFDSKEMDDDELLDQQIETCEVTEEAESVNDVEKLCGENSQSICLDNIEEVCQVTDVSEYFNKDEAGEVCEVIDVSKNLNKHEAGEVCEVYDVIKEDNRCNTQQKWEYEEENDYLFEEKSSVCEENEDKVLKELDTCLVSSKSDKKEAIQASEVLENTCENVQSTNLTTSNSSISVEFNEEQAALSAGMKKQLQPKVERLILIDKSVTKQKSIESSNVQETSDQTESSSRDEHNEQSEKLNDCIVLVSKPVEENENSFTDNNKEISESENVDKIPSTLVLKVTCENYSIDSNEAENKNYGEILTTSVLELPSEKKSIDSNEGENRNYGEVLTTSVLELPSEKNSMQKSHGTIKDSIVLFVKNNTEEDFNQEKENEEQNIKLDNSEEYSPQLILKEKSDEQNVVSECSNTICPKVIEECQMAVSEVAATPAASADRMNQKEIVIAEELAAAKCVNKCALEDVQFDPSKNQNKSRKDNIKISPEQSAYDLKEKEDELCSEASDEEIDELTATSNECDNETDYEDLEATVQAIKQELECDTDTIIEDQEKVTVATTSLACANEVQKDNNAVKAVSVNELDDSKSSVQVNTQIKSQQNGEIMKPHLLDSTPVATGATAAAAAPEPLSLPSSEDCLSMSLSMTCAEIGKAEENVEHIVLSIKPTASDIAAENIRSEESKEDDIKKLSFNEVAVEEAEDMVNREVITLKDLSNSTSENKTELQTTIDSTTLYETEKHIIDRETITLKDLNVLASKEDIMTKSKDKKENFEQEEITLRDSTECSTEQNVEVLFDNILQEAENDIKQDVKTFKDLGDVQTKEEDKTKDTAMTSSLSIEQKENIPEEENADVKVERLLLIDANVKSAKSDAVEQEKKQEKENVNNKKREVIVLFDLYNDTEEPYDGDNSTKNNSSSGNNENDSQKKSDYTDYSFGGSQISSSNTNPCVLVTEKENSINDPTTSDNYDCMTSAVNSVDLSSPIMQNDNNTTIPLQGNTNKIVLEEEEDNNDEVNLKLPGTMIYQQSVIIDDENTTIQELFRSQDKTKQETTMIIQQYECMKIVPDKVINEVMESTVKDLEALCSISDNIMDSDISDINKLNCNEKNKMSTLDNEQYITQKTNDCNDGNPCHIDRNNVDFADSVVNCILVNTDANTEVNTENEISAEDDSQQDEENCEKEEDKVTMSNNDCNEHSIYKTIFKKPEGPASLVNNKYALIRRYTSQSLDKKKIQHPSIRRHIKKRSVKIPSTATKSVTTKSTTTTNGNLIVPTDK